MSPVRRFGQFWRDRFFLVLAGIAIGLAARSLFPPVQQEHTDLRKLKTPVAEQTNDAKK